VKGDAAPSRLKRKSLGSTNKGPALPRYRVILHADLPLPPPGSEVQPRGFYVTRIVTAESAAEAGVLQSASCKPSESSCGWLLCTGTHLISLFSEIALAPHSHIEQVNRSGYVFYEDD